MIIKEDTRDIGYVFDSNIADFIPHLGLMPFSLDMTKAKPRACRDGTFQMNPSIHTSINSKAYPEILECTIECGTVHKTFCQQLWELRASFPDQHLVLIDNDISGAFPQRQYHPDATSGNACIAGKRLIVSQAVHFVGQLGPHSWEPVSWAWSETASFLQQHSDYQTPLNNNVIKLLSIPDEPLPPTPTTKTKFDSKILQ